MVETPNNRSDVNVAARPSGQSPIHVAAEKGFEEVLEVFFSDESLEANVDARDSRGLTPMYLAAKGKHGSCVQLLRSKGADLNIRCGSDNLTVRQACCKSQPQFVASKQTSLSKFLLKPYHK